MKDSVTKTPIFMRNFKVILAYDGSDFAGWQVQPGLATIQGTLASAIGRITGEKVLPQGSGRTDAGVHALGQVASFSMASPIPVGNIISALNDVLPSSIRILTASQESPDFHARKDATSKTYLYRMYRDAICPPFLARYVWHYPFPLKESAMQEAAGFIIGEHDFTSFAAVDPERELRSKGILGANSGAPNVRTIFESCWNREGSEFVYSVRGSGFLHHMVRNLVGTFLLVGKGTLREEDIGKILKARRRSAAGATAPAQGLYLMEVQY
ncbi:MAG: tRNA pseudouridine(38-40) synthase TruA [Acidobacteriaceae bacterium]